MLEVFKTSEFCLTSVQGGYAGQNVKVTGCGRSA